MSEVASPWRTGGFDVRTIAAVPSLSGLGQLPKRLVLGRPVRSDRAGESLLPKHLALPIFASDPLSSVAYATQEILLILTLAGTTFLFLAPWLAAAVVLLLTVVVLSYRQVVHAYPSGGGDYEVAMKNLGQFAGLVVASALLTDYVLTVAVSVTSGTDNIISAFPGLDPHRVLIAVTLVALLAAANLRGVRESGKTFAVPTYLFIGGIVVMIVTGLIRDFVIDDRVVAESAQLRHRARVRLRQADRPGADLLRAAGLRLRLHRADRRGGDRQRRAGLPAAEEQERRDHAGADGRHRRADVRRGDRAGADLATCSTSRTPAT